LDCQRNRFHPVFNFLENLKWDGVPRLENWAPVYLGAQDNPYNQKVGRYFVISMIARIYKPGCKCDYMLVLEGDQGIGKSKACSILFGRYFSDYLPDIASKDACHHVSSFWGIEIAEMHVFTRAETAALKSFISRTEEQYRPPYGRMEVRLPRQCIFIGTTNQDRYLKDETGGRRFWPVKCGRIDIQKLKDDRNQLLAEAVVRFKKGWAWWPDQEFEEHTIKPEQAERQEFDELENILINQIRLGMGGDRIKRMTVAEIFQVVLNQGSERLPTHGEQIRIGKILTRLESTGVIGSVKVMGKKHYDLTNLKSEPS
jgi:predicted P-loop ATPase